MGLYVSCGFYIATFILCAAFLFYRHNKKYRRSKEYVVMTFLLWNLLITGVIETITIVLKFYNVANLIVYEIILDHIYFFIHTTLSPAFALYVLLVNGAAKNKGKKYFFLLFSEMIIPEILILINPFTNCVFYYEMVEGNIVYNRNWGMIILYIVAIQYLVYGMYYLVKTWSVLSNNYMKGYPFFLGIIVLGILIQLIYPMIFPEALEVEAFFETIALVGLIAIVDCNDSLVDLETKFKNGVSYRINIKLYHKYKYNFTVINIKFANLKYYQNLISKKANEGLIKYITETIINLFPKVEKYRYSNNTFIIILPKHPLCDKYIKKLQEKIDKPLEFDNHTVYLQTVISVAKVPNDIDTVDEHIKILEIKPSVDKQVTIVTGEGLKFVKRHSLVDAAIHRAIKEKSFLVYYQPIWDKETNSIISCEALCRLIDKDLGFISPAEFIPLAEETGTIVSLGNIIIEKVCKDISELRFEDLGIKYVEINLSLYQLRDDNLADFILENLKIYNISPSMINLEITESRDLEEALGFNNFIQSLMSKGFTFSLDDYGTAYSNIANITSMNYKNIKIDSSILWKSINDSNTRQLLELTIKTFRNIGNDIIQEGVETKEQLDLVTNAGCNMVQGYYFSKPLPRLEFVEFVKNFIKENN